MATGGYCPVHNTQTIARVYHSETTTTAVLQTGCNCHQTFCIGTRDTVPSWSFIGDFVQLLEKADIAGQKRRRAKASQRISRNVAPVPVRSLVMMRKGAAAYKPRNHC